MFLFEAADASNRPYSMFSVPKLSQPTHARKRRSNTKCCAVLAGAAGSGMCCAKHIHTRTEQRAFPACASTSAGLQAEMTHACALKSQSDTSLLHCYYIAARDATCQQANCAGDAITALHYAGSLVAHLVQHTGKT
jgi:hypothetical protein